MTTGRLPQVDSLRGLAILLMVAVHSLRGLPLLDGGGAGGDEMLASAIALARSFMLTVEPYVSALFLTLAGFSLALAAGRTDGRTDGRPTGSGPARRIESRRHLLRVVRRAAGLVVCSWLIFWVHGGINLPYPFLSAEILYTIGLGCLIFLPVARPGLVNAALLALAIAAGSALTLFAEAVPDSWPALLAQGPGAHLPNLLFLPLGITLGWWLRAAPAAAAGPGTGMGLRLLTVVAAGAAVVAGYHLWVAPRAHVVVAEAGLHKPAFTALWTAPFGRTVARRRLVVDADYGSRYDLRWAAWRLGLADQPPERYLRSRAFWTKRLLLVPYLAALVALTFAAAWWPGWSRAGPRLAAPLRLLGRHSLLLYLLHLALLALVVGLAGANRLPPGVTLLVIALLLVALLGSAWAADRWGAGGATDSGGDIQSGGSG